LLARRFELGGFRTSGSSSSIASAKLLLSRGVPVGSSSSHFSKWLSDLLVDHRGAARNGQVIEALRLLALCARATTP
jgi:hypothetical protein